MSEDSEDGSKDRKGQDFKKGLWTQEEDNTLALCVQRFKEGNWSTIAMKCGLQRSGKSCRLRWVKHLSPHVRSGPLTEEEQRKVIELQKVHGNKWSHIAQFLPGRSDNTIKNFWNSHRKRLARRAAREAAARAKAQGLAYDVAMLPGYEGYDSEGTLRDSSHMGGSQLGSTEEEGESEGDTGQYGSSYLDALPGGPYEEASSSASSGDTQRMRMAGAHGHAPRMPHQMYHMGGTKSPGMPPHGMAPGGWQQGPGLGGSRLGQMRGGGGPLPQHQQMHMRQLRPSRLSIAGATDGGAAGGPLMGPSQLQRKNGHAPLAGGARGHPGQAGHPQALLAPQHPGAPRQLTPAGGPPSFSKMMQDASLVGGFAGFEPGWPSPHMPKLESMEEGMQSNTVSPLGGAGPPNPFQYLTSPTSLAHHFATKPIGGFSQFPNPAPSPRFDGSGSAFSPRFDASPRYGSGFKFDLSPRFDMSPRFEASPTGTFESNKLSPADHFAGASSVPAKKPATSYSPSPAPFMSLPRSLSLPPDPAYGRFHGLESPTLASLLVSPKCEGGAFGGLFNDSPDNEGPPASRQ
ncbi:Myb domain protein [Klebsormidium nitens]|uniref:Myb domain protein n=1 Tax=Klebsormidium nitens TaxID=105231 RepID=A0A1Y1I8I1_KLENI|nr:Myb domain protein [Klebsormidium nitens]|eukprot:GAQ86262.1 Myb domain protein [Klebsormidium nitens]